MSKKVLNELSLAPNLLANLGGSGNGTQPQTTSQQKPNSQSIVNNTKNLTNQINQLMAKIAAAKQQAAKASQPQQQQLTQTVNQLQQQLQALSNPNQDEEETKSEKIGATVGGIAGELAVPEAPEISIPVGQALGKKAGAYIGKKLFSQQDEQGKMKKSKLSNINKYRMKKTVDESLAGTVGDVAKGAIDTAGDIGGAIPVVGGALKGAANIASRGVGAVLGSNQDEETTHKFNEKQREALSKLDKQGYKTSKIHYSPDHGTPTVTLTKKTGSTVHTAHVDEHGNVNGMTPGHHAAHKHNEHTSAVNEQTAILNFLKSISQKNYAQADKYLGSLVNEKLKNRIAKAAK